VVGDNQQQEEGEEVGQGEEEGAKLVEGNLFNGLAFECVVSICEICNGTHYFILFWTCNNIYVMQVC
jgi:hypothetical protein